MFSYDDKLNLRFCQCSALCSIDAIYLQLVAVVSFYLMAVVICSIPRRMVFKCAPNLEKPFDSILMNISRTCVLLSLQFLVSYDLFFFLLFISFIALLFQLVAEMSHDRLFNFKSRTLPSQTEQRNIPPSLIEERMKFARSLGL